MVFCLDIKSPLFSFRKRRVRAGATVMRYFGNCQERVKYAGGNQSAATLAVGLDKTRVCGSGYMLELPTLSWLHPSTLSQPLFQSCAVLHRCSGWISQAVGLPFLNLALTSGQHSADAKTSWLPQAARAPPSALEKIGSLAQSQDSDMDGKGTIIFLDWENLFGRGIVGLETIQIRFNKPKTPATTFP
jgi:hypothetical protein